jgi:hypothetical protein
MRAYRMPGLTGVNRFARALAHLLMRVGAALAELHRQQERFTAKRMSQDRFIENPFEAPDTYAEFLLRTNGLLRHEPSARRRLSGHPVH